MNKTYYVKLSPASEIRLGFLLFCLTKAVLGNSFCLFSLSVYVVVLGPWSMFVIGSVPQQILWSRAERGMSMWSCGQPVWVFGPSVHRVILLSLLIVKILLLKNVEHFFLHKVLLYLNCHFKGSTVKVWEEACMEFCPN